MIITNTLIYSSTQWIFIELADLSYSQGCSRTFLSWINVAAKDLYLFFHKNKLRLHTYIDIKMIISQNWFVSLILYCLLPLDFEGKCNGMFSWTLRLWRVPGIVPPVTEVSMPHCLVLSPHTWYLNPYTFRILIHECISSMMSEYLNY